MSLLSMIVYFIGREDNDDADDNDDVAGVRVWLASQSGGDLSHDYADLSHFDALLMWT